MSIFVISYLCSLQMYIQTLSDLTVNQQLFKHIKNKQSQFHGIDLRLCNVVIVTSPIKCVCVTMETLVLFHWHHLCTKSKK